MKTMLIDTRIGKVSYAQTTEKQVLEIKEMLKDGGETAYIATVQHGTLYKK